jgi:hypothetical protein
MPHAAIEQPAPQPHATQLVRAKTVAMLQPVRILGTAVAVEGMTSIRSTIVLD